jgi:hypothetical protein
MRTGRISRTGLVLSVLGPLMLGPPLPVAVGQTSECAPEEVMSQLNQMNIQFKTLLDRLKSYSDEELREHVPRDLKAQIRAIEAAKMDMLGRHFPQAYGIDFIRWYVPLEQLDFQIDDATDAKRDQFVEQKSSKEPEKHLKRAQSPVGILEALFEEAAMVPEEVRQEFHELKNVLRDLLADESSGKLDDPKGTLDMRKLQEFKERARRITGGKHVMLFRFPQVFGIAFDYVYKDLYGIDERLRTALTGKRTQGNVSVGKDFKESLEKRLAPKRCGAVPPPPPGSTIKGEMGFAHEPGDEVRGTGVFFAEGGSPANPLDAVRVVIPPYGSEDRAITNYICPMQLPNGVISSTTHANDTLTCQGGSLPLQQEFSMRVRTFPEPSDGMGGDLYGRQDGSFQGPFHITGP